MKRAAALLLLAPCLAAACGGGEREGAEVPLSAELLRLAPARSLYEKPLGAAVRLEQARDDEEYLRAFVANFTSMTPENALKWEVVQPRPGEFDFDRADALVELASRTGKRVRGHTLVWDQQLPAWVDDEDRTPADVAAILRDHVRTVVGRYRGRIGEWDVVNEPFDADGAWTASVWYRKLGRRYVTIAFRAAHRADPGARLFVNEAGAERSSPRARALRRLVEDLRRQGVPVHGVGFQNHTAVGAALGRAQLTRALRSYGRLGVRTAITEMDVTIPAEDPPRNALSLQARAYRDAARACLDADSCTGLTVWGVGDRYSWRGAAARPLPVALDGRPKPALQALRDTLER